jgi:hypothetical protein
MTRLRTLVAALDSAGDVTLPTPRHGATETLEAGGRTLQLGSNESPVKPWRALIDGVRKLLQDEAVDSPRAAIELAAGPLSARLVHAGAESLDVDLGSIAVRVVRIAEDGTSTGRWNGFAEGRVDDGERLVATPAWVTTHPGWAVPVPFDHGLALVGGDSLQVWVEVDLRESDATRHGQLYARVEGGR